VDRDPSPSHVILVSECEHPDAACESLSAPGASYVSLRCRRCSKRLVVPVWKILGAHSLRHSHVPSISATTPSFGSPADCVD